MKSYCLLAFLIFISSTIFLFSCKKDVIEPSSVSPNIDSGDDHIVNFDSIPESFKEIEKGTTTLIVDLRKVRKSHSTQ